MASWDENKRIIERFMKDLGNNIEGVREALADDARWIVPQLPALSSESHDGVRIAHPRRRHPGDHASIGIGRVLTAGSIACANVTRPRVNAAADPGPLGPDRRFGRAWRTPLESPAP